MQPVWITLRPNNSPQTFLEVYDHIISDLDGRPDTKETWVRHNFATALLLRTMQDRDAKWSDYIENGWVHAVFGEVVAVESPK